MWCRKRGEWCLFALTTPNGGRRALLVDNQKLTARAASKYDLYCVYNLYYSDLYDLYEMYDKSTGKTDPFSPVSHTLAYRYA